MKKTLLSAVAVLTFGVVATPTAFAQDCHIVFSDGWVSTPGCKGSEGPELPAKVTTDWEWAQNMCRNHVLFENRTGGTPYLIYEPKFSQICQVVDQHFEDTSKTLTDRSDDHDLSELETFLELQP